MHVRGAFIYSEYWIIIVGFTVKRCMNIFKAKQQKSLLLVCVYIVVVNRFVWLIN